MERCIDTTAKYTYRIELDTVSEVKNFVRTATEVGGKLVLRSGDKFTVNAKSLLGVLLAQRVNWSNLMLEADHDCYVEFRKYIVND